MFFGCKLKQGKAFSFQKTNNIIHISQACLGGKPDDTSIHVKLEVDDNQYNLCVLKKNFVESYKIDHFIAWGKNSKSYKLFIIGGGSNAEVNFTGYIEKEDGDQEEEFYIGEMIESNKNDLALSEKENNKRKNSKNSNEEKEIKENISNESKRKLSETKNENPVEKAEVKKDFAYGTDSENDLFEDDGDEEIEKLLQKKRKNSANEEKFSNPQKLNEIQKKEKKLNKFERKIKDQNFANQKNHKKHFNNNYQSNYKNNKK